MNIKKISLSAMAFAMLLACASCGNKTTQAPEAEAPVEDTLVTDFAAIQTLPAEAGDSIEAVAGILSIDLVKDNAEQLVGKKMTLQGICTHTCAHGATKIFLMGSDDTKTLRAEAGKLGAFDKKCMHSIVRVTGVLQETRITEETVKQMEEAYKNNTAKKHGNGQEVGCDSEKKAMGVKGNTAEELFQSYRDKIAENKAKNGKDYTSDFYLVATSYEIK